ncbi:uncharacterized protein LOC131950341 [Physella acuta]|uniref:uncharacterized protein LOC131950341 n=1 Tax=Physella acuta TaxID=109671 RepID=UPI0027DB0506|nr:uncharacterized protein LOC131950341 [Physella acuta]
MSFSYLTGPIWVGGNDLGRKHRYTWEGNRGLVQSLHFDATPRSEASCVAIDRSGTLRKQNCHFKMKFLCAQRVTGCPFQPAIENGIWTQCEYHIGGRCILQCDEMYRLQGDNMIICGLGVLNRWSTAGICKVKACPYPPRVKDGIWTQCNYDYGGTCVLQCDESFTLQGKSTVVCQNNGNWTAPGSCIGSEHRFEYNDTSFVLYRTKEDWHSANTSCIAKGLLLAKITDIEQAYALSKYFSFSAYEIAWVGANDINKENDFVWIGERGGVNSSLWAPREPGGGNNKNCAGLRFDGLLLDWICDSKMTYLCEKVKIEVTYEYFIDWDTTHTDLVYIYITTQEDFMEVVIDDRNLTTYNQKLWKGVAYTVLKASSRNTVARPIHFAGVGRFVVHIFMNIMITSFDYFAAIPVKVWAKHYNFVVVKDDYSIVVVSNKKVTVSILSCNRHEHSFQLEK